MMVEDQTLDLAPGDSQTLAKHERAERGEAEPLERGTTLGRYLVIERVGEGGMGVVVRAYDPKLHREIALKRLHSGTLDSEAEARLLREAQAMAQLSHPNVITIHDVESTADGVVMAMEYVEGQTLAEWIKEGPHPIREVLEHFIQAGEGLLAAHDAGLVHRDFKPSNVIIGVRGRVQVMDFGLARAEAADDGAEAQTAENATRGDDSTDRGQAALASRRSLASSDSRRNALGRSSNSSNASSSVQLTEAGAVMGTPAYMAPEQHRGEVADARSDQYAFCLSLWEGLWGTRPFTGDLATIVAAKHGEPPPAPPSAPGRGKVPRTIQDALRRGLDPRSSRRWPSISELLDALAYDPTRERHKAWALGGAAVVTLGLGAGVMAWQTSRPEPCTDARTQLQGIWDENRRVEVEAALEGTELSYAEATSERVTEHLDHYSDAWVHMHTEACEATSVQKVQSEALLDLRMQCLRRRKLRLGALVDVLGTPDPEVAKTAIEQVMNLPPLDHCADAEALSAAVPPPEHPEVARAVEEIRDELERARVVVGAGHYEDARTQLDTLIERARALGYDPLEAEVLELGAALARHEGDFEASVELGTRAYELALRSGHERIAAKAASELIYVTGSRLAQLEIGHTWAASARALAQRVDPGGAQEAVVINFEGVLAYRGGDFASAIVHFERALPMVVDALGENHDQVATILNHLGAMLDEQGRYTEAEPHFRRALAIQTRVFGEDHPRTTISIDNLALCIQAQGRNNEALALHLRSLEVRKRALNDRHPDTGLTHNNLGWDYMGKSDPDTAAEHFAEGLSIFEDSYGPEHPRVAMAAESLALAEVEREHFAEAEALHRRALKIRRSALGEDHPNVALSLAGLGNLASRQEHFDEAIEWLQQALSIIEAKSEGAERYLADILSGLGRALLGAERFTEARVQLERALKQRGDGGIDPLVVMALHLDLARAIAGMGDDLDAARAHAQTAKHGIEGIEGEQATALRAEIDEWLTENGVTNP